MKKPTWMKVGLVLFLVCFVFASVAMAQDGDGEVAVKKKSLFDLLQAGGVVGWVIVLMSVASMALVIEHFVNLKRDKLVPPEIIMEVEALLDEGAYEEAIAMCEGGRNYITAVLGAAISRLDDGYDSMIASMEDAIAEENLKLNQKISYLSLIGNLAPMMGLLGTVMGMIGSFQTIEQMKNPPASKLAGGIYEALVTTCLGLIVAIPTLAFYFFFRNKVGRMTFELSSIAAELTDKLRPIAEGQ